MEQYFTDVQIGHFYHIYKKYCYTPCINENKDIDQFMSFYNTSSNAIDKCIQAYS